MAGDWIKMRADLHTHPKVVRMASALKADKLRVVGGLHAVWCLFDVHSVDGVLDGYTLDALDDHIGFAGFGAAMVAVKWLEVGEESLLTPRFDEHNGQSAKRRAQETERKRVARKVSAPDADEKRSREEKRREEVNKGAPSRSSPPARPEVVTEQTWADWLQLRKAKKAAVTDTVIAQAAAEAEKAGLPLQRFLEIWCLRGSQGLQADWLRADERRTSSPADIARMTVPGSKGPDPALEKIKADEAKAVPPPAHIRAQIADALKGKVH